MKVGFIVFLALIFITLKLTGYITWSWWLVTLPLWGGVALIFSLLIIGPVIAIVGASFLIYLMA